MKAELEHRNMSKITVERLGALCKFFEGMTAAESKKFDMRSYFEVNENKRLSAAAKKLLKKVVETAKKKGRPEDLYDTNPYYKMLPADQDVMHVCNTAACALGWAATIPAFCRAGLKMEIGVDTGGGRLTSRADFSVRGKAMEPDEAAQKFFDIPYELAEELFGSYGPGGAQSPHAWAKAVRYIIQTDGIGYY